MKIITLLLAFLIISFQGIATNYYFSTSSGDDQKNDGKTATTAWQSIDKLKTILNLLQAGDSVLFKCNDTFQGQLVLSRSGKISGNIYFGSYGSGRKPVISGTVPVKNWVQTSKNIWAATCPGCNDQVTNFFINGIPQQIGRWPNATDCNKGYLTYEGHSGTSQITDNQLTDTINWTGAEAVVRRVRWILDRLTIKSHNGKKLQFTTPVDYQFMDGFGYFIQNDPRTLDQQGEWYYNPSGKRFSLYSKTDPNAFVIQVPQIENLVCLNKLSYITIENIEFSGSGKLTMDINDCKNLIIRNVEFDYAGVNAVDFKASNNVVFESNLINHTNNNAFVQTRCRNFVIRNNVVKNTAMIAGMGLGADGQYNAVQIGGSNLLVEYNKIDSVGYIGLNFSGDTLVIKDNVISNFCMTKDDGGGLYTWSNGAVNYSRKLIGNILLNAVGAPEGSGWPGVAAEGIYIDDRSANVDIIGNTVYRCGNNGIYIHNANHINLTGNTIYDNNVQLVMRHDPIASKYPITNCVVDSNIFVARDASQMVASIETFGNTFSDMGLFDHNAYCRPFDDCLTIYAKDQLGSTLSLDHWRSKHQQDVHSFKSPISLSDYKLIDVRSSNFFSHSEPTSDIERWSSRSKYNNHKVVFEKGDGDSMKTIKASYTFPSGKADGNLTFASNKIKLVGNKCYRLSFSAKSSSPDVFMSLIVRKSGEINDDVVARKNFVVDNLGKSFELLIFPKGTDPNAVAEFEIPEFVGSVMFDDLELVEVNVEKISPDDFIRFEYNASKANKSISIPEGYVDAKGNSVFGNILLKPFSSIVLFKKPISSLGLKSKKINREKKWIDFNKNGIKDTYEDPDATIDNRDNNLLSQMSVAEKISMLSETAPAIDRLGIKKYYHGNEALHGVVRPGKFTVFPQAIGLAATWNPELIHQVSGVISDEARARWNELGQGDKQTEKYSDLLAFWSPTVNMARDPRWGRTPETYGEDPYLTSRIGVSFVRGLQGDDPRYLKVVSTPKHFAGNNEEHNRFECKAVMSERALRSYYLPAFKALITEGKAESIMTAYNAINGIPCTANKWLLTDILHNEWGFNGYVVSDCGAPGFLYTPHNYAPTREDAAAMAMKAGLDLECSGYCNECFIFRDYLSKAYEMGKVTESEINTSAFRVLRARFKLGLFDDPSLNPYSSISPELIGNHDHQQLALETARQSIVLLKNSNNILPLDIKKIKSIAVLGINAATCELGDYSGIPINDPVSPLQGIINKAGKKVKVQTLPWTGKIAQHEIIPSNFFDYGVGEKGLKAEYFSNPDLSGTPASGFVENVLFDPVNQAPNPNIPQAPMSIRWSGNLVPKISGKYMFGIKKSGGCKLYINEKLVVDNWLNDIENDEVNVDLEAGKSYQIKVEYVCRSGKSYCSLSWETPGKKAEDQFRAEKLLAKKSDVAIVVLGINKSIEMEGRDRTTLELPANQQKFIQEIYKANPKTIVVLVAGSSLAVNWIQANVPAIVNAWYPGEQGGNAIAEVLFGDYNPAGRLPLTYYKSTDDLPAFNDYEVFNGRTYMYLEKKPLYAFGYGLSYTSFNYSNLRIDKSVAKMGDTISVNVDIQNTGKYDGDEVVQLYLQQKSATVKLPQKQLKAFKRISLKQGETQMVCFTLSRKDLSYWNEKNDFVLESGEYHIQIGASSDDIRQEASFNIAD